MPEELPQRNGIGRIAHEAWLIDIDADAHHGTLHHRSSELVIEKHSTDFLLTHIHIVRPFHTDSFDIRIKRLSDCQTSDFRKIELLGSAHPLWTKDEGEHEIFSAIALPFRSALSVTTSLKIGTHHPHLPCWCSIHRYHLHRSGHGGVMLANPM